MPQVSYNLQLNNAPVSQELLSAISLIEVEDDAALASAFRIRVFIGLTDSGDWTWVAEDMFKPLTPVAISVQLDTGVNERVMNGYITAHNVHFESTPGASFVQIVGMDSSLLMSLEEKIVAWKDMSDSDIATQIFSTYGFSARVDNAQPSYTENEVTLIQRGTDLAFLRRLARRNGFELYVETDAATGVTTGHFHKPILAGQAQKDLALAFGGQANVKKLEVRYDALRPTTAEAGGVAAGDKSAQSATTSSSSLNALGASSTLDMLSQQPKSLPARASAFENAELQTRTQAVVESSSWAVAISGEVDVTAYQAVIRSRRTILVKGAGTRYSGTYYVTRVLHKLTPDTYTQQFELTRNALGLSGSEAFST